MHETHAHRAPAWGPVLAEQFRATGIAIRREAGLFTLGTILFTLMVVLSWLRHRPEGDAAHGLMSNLEVVLPIVIGGVIAPLAVWKEQGPSRRGYHWAMPVSRFAHDLTKVLAGWAWYMIAVGGFLLWVVLLTAVTQGISSAEMSRIPAWSWLVPFVGATATYLAGTAVALSADHPWRWYAGVVIGFAVMLALFEAGGWRAGSHAFESVLGGRWGLETLVSGHIDVPVAATMENGRLVAPGIPPSELRVVTMRTASDGGQVVQAVRSVLSFPHWAGSAAMWLGLSLGAVLLAAARHQER
jgi:hypothetical protein